MSNQLFIDKKNKIFVTETANGNIEVAVEANGQSVILKVKNMDTLSALIYKLSLIEN